MVPRTGRLRGGTWRSIARHPEVFRITTPHIVNVGKPIASQLITRETPLEGFRVVRSHSRDQAGNHHVMFEYINPQRVSLARQKLDNATLCI